MPFEIIKVADDKGLPSSKIGGPAQNFNDYEANVKDASISIRKRLVFRLSYIAIAIFTGWLDFIMLRNLSLGTARYSPLMVVPGLILFLFFLYQAIFERATLIDKAKNKVIVSPLSPLPLNREEHGFGSIAGVIVIYSGKVRSKRSSVSAYELNILLHKTGSKGINVSRHTDFSWQLKTGESIARMIDVPLYYVSRSETDENPMREQPAAGP
jgi:hypothetical protein